MSDSPFKKVDEEWKEQVEREKAQFAKQDPAQRKPAPSAPRAAEAAAPSAARHAAPEAPAPEETGEGESEFQSFVSTLGLQAYMALGEIADPSGRISVNLEQARYLIEVLLLLEKKTKGNLTQQESTMLQSLLYELRVKFVEKKGL